MSALLPEVVSKVSVHASFSAPDAGTGQAATGPKGDLDGFSRVFPFMHRSNEFGSGILANVFLGRPCR